METLMNKLVSEEFLDYFVQQILVGATELFRDPTVWILLKNTYLANLLKENYKTRIWLPMCASGEEFYSLAILLKENGWNERTEIYVSSPSNAALATIQNGWMNEEKLEISVKNYSRFQGTGQLTDYYKKTNCIAFNQSLFANTTFFKEGIDFNQSMPHMHLILFRNQLIYFNPTLQYKICDAIYNRLAAKGLLFLGILEEIDTTTNTKFVAVEKTESVYQRKN